jgi:hypothetical protein
MEPNMWLFKKKDPALQLQKSYEALQKEAMQLQRSGKIPEFAKKTAEADKVLTEIEKLKAQVQ